MEKAFDSAAVEARITGVWDGPKPSGPADRSAPGAQPYCVMIPPPNVTGSLHIGHALNNTLQDVLCRFERMRGKDVLWQPGMDHAGIATQMVVERQLMERQEPGRREMGRDAFVERVWAWKDESGGQIVGQLQRLGASCDWSRMRFTMDEGLSAAVRQGVRHAAQAGPDLSRQAPGQLGPEVPDGDLRPRGAAGRDQGHLWHFRYPVVDGDGRETGDFITVATTRPETMLGDTAVAVHPDDERYKRLVGQRVKSAAGGRLDPDRRRRLQRSREGLGRGQDHAGARFQRLRGRQAARSAVDQHLRCRGAAAAPGQRRISWTGADPDSRPGAFWTSTGRIASSPARRSSRRMEELGLLEKIEPHAHAVPHGDRSNAVIEPWLTDQWYVDAATLAKPALAAVREGQTTFIPKNWEKTYFEWLENIQPWCISRQLWWGHQIPAWYGPDGRVFVAATETEADDRRAMRTTAARSS